MQGSQDRTDAAAERHGRGTVRLAAALIAASLASGCDDKRDQQTASSFDATAHARRVAEDGILARAGRRGAVLRAVQVYRQALAGTVTVCGQINPTGRGDQAYIPFVTVVTYEEAPDRGQPRFQLVQHLADSSAAATRVYVEMVSRCFEGGGPRDARSVQTLPPLPTGLPHEAEEMPAPSAAQQPAAGAAPVTTAVAAPPLTSSRNNVTTRQHANLRSNPAGGGAVLRVVPPGSSLRVFGEAPGGWYQVGDTEPWGWIHGSLLDP
ncbi:SH3 domain-containing protein [Plastoroseomonas hellenica]|uniref:SH3 domain-containing protein n=1 Tax=Plastoroseomonas hellenica TaxID=2687306 RepID=UPI001BA81343|nr:SH3 domain-containing protein [Plastoroseomonas hellenica]MBR0643280.1 SH3 domain-containing protein [Plastoroseomonas hellenica]